VDDFIVAAVIGIVAGLGAAWIVDEPRFVARHMGAAALMGLSIAFFTFPTGTTKLVAFAFPLFGGLILWNFPRLREAYKKDQAEAARLRALRDEQEARTQTR